MMPSDVATATYLFETPHSVPVVTLAMNQKDFDDVYAVSSPFVPVVEREGHIQYFEKDGSLGVETSAGIRVSGASTILSSETIISRLSVRSCFAMRVRTA